MTSKGRFLASLFLVCGLLLVGCKKTNQFAPAKLSGKVTYGGAPVTAGTMIFHAADGSQFPTMIGSDGSYGIELPVGEMVVTIETESVNPKRKVPVYDANTAGSGGFGKLYGKSGGGGGPGRKKTEDSTPEGASSSAELYVKIPARYADKGKSGLTVTLAAGSNKKDFDLTD
ncbi:MAG TPA: hypothetical protein VKE40_15780 [Gemmataceae bacterium]|nr:hypothetical protein [Gemmataceae bacterium]